MPAPAVYVIAVMGGIAAAYAFKEFVYEPHIVPAAERWQAQFNASRARRRQRASPVVVPESTRDDGDDDGDTELQTLRRRPGPGDDDDDDDDDEFGERTERRSSHEPEQMVSREVAEWRSDVDRNQPSGLRYRTNVNASGSAIEDSNTYLPYTPLSPTHIVFDFSNETSPTSSHPSHHSLNTFNPDAAIRVAGPPSTVLDSPISSVRPSDSASQPGHFSPRLLSPPQLYLSPHPEEHARSLSFAYDAQALSLSPPVIIQHPQLPTPTASSRSDDMTEFVVRPSHPHQLGLGLDFGGATGVGSGGNSRPDTPFSSLSLGSGMGSGLAGSGSYDFSSPRISVPPIRTHTPLRTQNNNMHTRTRSNVSDESEGSRTLLSPSEELFHSAISRRSSGAGAEFMSAVGNDTDSEGEEEGHDFDVLSPTRHSPDEFDFGDDGSDSDGSWGSVSGVGHGSGVGR